MIRILLQHELTTTGLTEALMFSISRQQIDVVALLVLDERFQPSEFLLRMMLMHLIRDNTQEMFVLLYNNYKPTLALSVGERGVWLTAARLRGYDQIIVVLEMH
jgi:hypothetical protein